MKQSIDDEILEDVYGKKVKVININGCNYFVLLDGINGNLACDGLFRNYEEIFNFIKNARLRENHTKPKIIYDTKNFEEQFVDLIAEKVYKKLKEKNIDSKTED